jgi:sarcosine oxidase subunit gamma
VTATQHSALDTLHEAMQAASAATRGAVTLRERPHLTHVNVRVQAAGRQALAKGNRFDLPEQNNTWRQGNPSILWLGPDEWLVVDESEQADRVESDLRDALAERWAAVVDVSDQRTLLELSGPGSRDVLASGCPLDLHPRAFGPGDCAQTILARASIVLAQRDDAPTYWLLVRRSFAAYHVRWLLDAMSELTPA